ncbi:hypothetical protein SME38J_05020 [Serratia marcescens]|nr:hypothetical protein SME38J_05020 [Serratia marcescens]
MWIPFRKKNKAQQGASRPGAWQSIFSFIHEPFGGAWQRNLEIEHKTVRSFYAVFSCISLIANDIAKMPVRHQKQDSKGVWRTAEKSEIAALLVKPNAFQNRIQFFEHWITSKLSHGNTYILIVRNTRDKPIELRILDPHKVTPLVADDGSVFYQINPDNLSGLPTEVVVPARELIHDRFNCFYHPLCGLSPLHSAGLAAMQGHHIQQSSAFFFKNGGKPSGVIEVPGVISQEKAKEIKDNWDSGYTGENAGKTGILSNGAKYNPVTMTASDAQVVEQLRMTAEIVCSVFHVPAYKVGVGSPPSENNIEALEQQYYSQCLQILIQSVEVSLGNGLALPGGSAIEFDINSLLRMDTERRYKTLGDAVKNTIMCPNEARAKENLPPVAGGDALYLQQQNFSLEALARRDASDDPFGKKTAAPPSEGPAATDDDEKGKSLSEAERSAIKSLTKGLLK